MAPAHLQSQPALSWRSASSGSALCAEASVPWAGGEPASTAPPLSVSVSQPSKSLQLLLSSCLNSCHTHLVRVKVRVRAGAGVRVRARVKAKG